MQGRGIAIINGKVAGPETAKKHKVDHMWFQDVLSTVSALDIFRRFRSF